MPNSQPQFADPLCFAHSEQNNENELSVCLHSLDDSLHSLHPSMRLSANPVLKKTLLDIANNEQIKEVLVQYCFLPAEIVNLLSIARARFSASSSIESELSRNIAEEQGSRTHEIFHYDILVSALNGELDLLVTDVQQKLCTKAFLDALKEFLNTATQSCVAGAIYGIESAAVPELSVVAALINHYALSAGKTQPIITFPAERASIKNSRADYSLNTFFAMHLLDFEVGHKNGFALAIKKQHVEKPLDLDQIKIGFDFVLNQMDQWWEELAAF